jgi:hypothetical protein
MKALDADPNATQRNKRQGQQGAPVPVRRGQTDAKKDYETIKKIAEDKVTMSEDRDRGVHRPGEGPP